MANSTVTTPRVVIGLDLSDRNAHVFALDGETGEVLEDGKVSTTPKAFESRFRGYEGARIVLEAGTHSPWICDLLEHQGHEVVVANPRRLQLITESDKKSDRLDAQMLAQLGRAAPELLSPVWNRGSDQRADLAVIRARDMIVQARTALVNHVRSTVKTFGGRVVGCDAQDFHKNAGEFVPDAAKPAVQPLLEVLTGFDAKIKAYDKQIKELAKTKYPETKCLEQIAGVGALTALAYVLTIGDPRRFKSSRTLGSYLGLRPAQKDSGDSNPQLRITKGGNGYLRRLLVSSAHYVLGHYGPDTDLRRWGLALAERGGKKGKKRAVVAVARKLAVLLHRLWVTGDEYQPARKSASTTAPTTATPTTATPTTATPTTPPRSTTKTAPTTTAPTKTAPTKTAPTKTSPTTKTASTKTAPTKTAPTKTAPTRTPTRIGVTN